MSLDVARAVLFASKRGLLFVYSRQTLHFNASFLLIFKVILLLLSFTLFLPRDPSPCKSPSHFHLTGRPSAACQMCLASQRKRNHGLSRAEEPLLVCLLLDAEGVLVSQDTLTYMKGTESLVLHIDQMYLYFTQ